MLAATGRGALPVWHGAPTQWHFANHVLRAQGLPLTEAQANARKRCAKPNTCNCAKKATMSGWFNLKATTNEPFCIDRPAGNDQIHRRTAVVGHSR
jgi:hypothetical protein